GLSLGALVAARVGFTAPALVSKLTLIATSADAEAPESKRQLETTANRIERAGRITDDLACAWLELVFLSPTFFSAHPQTVAALKAIMQGNPVDGSVQAIRAVARRAPIRSALSGIRCPTLVIQAEQDKAHPLEDGDNLA